MSTFAGKDLRSYPDQICGGRTKSASVICPPGQNLLALSVPPDQIRGRTDFTVTPAIDRTDHEAATAVAVGDSTD